MITYRTKVLAYQRCPRSRYLLFEANGTGYEKVKVAAPLVTGGAAHEGFPFLLRGEGESAAIRAALQAFDETVSEHKGIEGSAERFQIEEQRALAEALVLIASRKVVPKLLETYEILEIEKQDVIDIDRSIQFMAIPDALMRSKEDGGLYILSWKTPASIPRRGGPRIDMQGMSEAWAIQHRLEEPVFGIQMAYILKGRRDDFDLPSGETIKRHTSPLVWGYEDHNGDEVSGYYWRCTEPHPMRKSKWYPKGLCETPGKRHKRTGSWELFSVWNRYPNLADWIDSQGVDLDTEWALPEPYLRRRDRIASWERQMIHQERKILQDLKSIKDLQDSTSYPGKEDIIEYYLDLAFPQHTENYCENLYGRQCPAYDICHLDVQPNDSPLYQIRQEVKHKLPEDED